MLVARARVAPIVLLIKGLAARVVLAVETQPAGEIAILTRQATLGETEVA